MLPPLSRPLHKGLSVHRRRLRHLWRTTSPQGNRLNVTAFGMDEDLAARARFDAKVRFENTNRAIDILYDGQEVQTSRLARSVLAGARGHKGHARRHQICRPARAGPRRPRPLRKTSRTRTPTLPYPVRARMRPCLDVVRDPLTPFMFWAHCVLVYGHQDCGTLSMV